MSGARGWTEGQRCGGVLLLADATIRCAASAETRHSHSFHSGVLGFRRAVWSDRSDGAASLVPPGSLVRRKLSELMEVTR